MYWSSLNIFQNYDIRQGNGAHRETSPITSLFVFVLTNKDLCRCCEWYLYGKVISRCFRQFPTDECRPFCANFFYFIIFHYTGMKCLFVCPPIYLIFHPSPLRSYNFPITLLRSGGILPNFCQLISAVECSRGMRSSLAGNEVGPSGKGLGLRCDTLSSIYKPHTSIWRNDFQLK